MNVKVGVVYDNLADLLDWLDVEHSAAHPHHVLLYRLPELVPLFTCVCSNKHLYNQNYKSYMYSTVYRVE